MEINGEDSRFLADFLSAEIMADFFDCPPQRANSDSYGEGVANIPSTVTSSEGPCSTASDQSSDEIQRLISKNTNCNTAKSTKNWVNKYAKWAADNHIQTDLALIPEDELDTILQRFYSEIRKNDGENYEPESLKVMQASLDRYLRDKGSTFSILKDRKFDISRKVLNGKAI